MNNEINSVLEKITPNVATEYLGKSIGNRKTKIGKVQQYARDMKNGNWEVNGEPIVFNVAGTLVDGHHRLLACIKSGCDFYSLVVRGVCEEVKTFDVGDSRSVSDILAMRGEELGTSKIVSLIKFIYSREFSQKNISEAEVNEYLRNESNKEYLSIINEFLKKNHSAGKNLVKDTASMYVFYYALKNGVSKDTISRFMDIVSSGLYENPSQQSAIILRNCLIEQKYYGGDSIRKYKADIVDQALADFVKGYPRKQKYIPKENPIYIPKRKANNGISFDD